jgi:sodium transport system permease protein
MIRPGVVGAIYRRELLDVLRDRRTIFMMIVFPVVLYPLIGYVLMNLAMTIQEKKRMVVIINAEALPTEPALLAPEGNRFAPNLFSRNPQDANLLEVSKAEKQSPWADVAQRDRMLRERLADLVVIVPDDLTGQIETGKAGNLEYVYNSADDQGQMTFGKVQSVVEQWKQQILSKRLKADSKTAEYTQPVTTQVRDIATKKESSAIVWSRIVPFILVLMSLREGTRHHGNAPDQPCPSCRDCLCQVYHSADEQPRYCRHQSAEHYTDGLEAAIGSFFSGDKRRAKC